MALLQIFRKFMCDPKVIFKITIGSADTYLGDLEALMVNNAI